MSRNEENKPLFSLSSQRANGSLLSSSRTPQSEDFFTDSVLDASKIPTPSPKKQPFSAAYRSRRVHGNARTLKDAWNATAGSSKGSGPGKDVASVRQRSLKPVPAQSLRRSPTPGQREPRRSTPSPQRFHMPVDLTSPNSELSSPPRGLTDVYQRIADEEDLAEQDGQMGDGRDEDDTGEFDSHSFNLTHTRDLPPNGRLVGEPVYQGASHRVTLSEYPTDVNKENHADEEVTSLSEASGLSFLKEITDQKLAAALTPHTIDRAKDRLRLEKAINTDRPISLNGHRARNGLTAENLQRNGSPVNQISKKNSSTGSVTTERSDPAPNVPRGWGAKAKAGKEWLRTRRQTSLNGINSSPGPESSQVDWALAAAGVKLPSVEDSLTPKGQMSLEGTPESVRKQSSLDRIRQWGFNDFTGQSLQVSDSPAVRIKPNLLDPNRDEEIAELARQAVTTNRLGEIGRQNSNELLPRLSRTPSAGLRQQITEMAKSSEKTKGVKFAEDGEEIPGTPIVVYRSSSSASKPNSHNSDHAEENKSQSHDRLQRLARAMSNSPAGTPSPEDTSVVQAERNSWKMDDRSDIPIKHGQISDTSRKSSKQVVDFDSTPQVFKVSDITKTPVVTGAWTDTILPDTVRTAKKQEQGLKYAQTPQVNPGGWVDTPMPGKRHSSALAPIPIEEETEELTNGIIKEKTDEDAPPAPAPSTILTVEKQSGVPTSALATLLDRAKQRLASQDITTATDGNDNTLNLGDATIESLEDLLTLDAADMTALIHIGAEAEARDQLLAGLDMNDPAAEAELLERLGSKLERLRTNIHDARKGISKLEHQVTHPSSNRQLQTTLKQEPCETCGSLHHTQDSHPFSSDQTAYLAIPIPRLYHLPRRDLGQWLPRPTFLGWVTLLVWCWYISESTMCELYCHPLYADHYDWPREREPVFPYALPTMLWRWSGLSRAGPVFLGPLWTLLVAVVRIVGQAFGLTDGFVDGAYSVPRSDLGGQIGSGGVGVAAGDGGGIDLSMMNDEYI